MYSQMLAALEKAGAPLVLVAGDLMLDRYLWGDVERVSPEAPVPVVQIDHAKTHTAVGGAGSVMLDLLALGARVIAAGVVGADPEGSEVLARLRKQGADVSNVVVDPKRHTTQKTRVLSKSHHLLRIDSEHRLPLDQPAAQDFLDRTLAAIGGADFIVLSDYDKGVLSRKAVQEIAAAARAAGKPVWADPAKGRDFSDFAGVNAITPNRRETEEAAGLKIPFGTLPETAAERLISKLGLDMIVITLDSEGLYYRTAAGEGAMVAGEPRAAYDVTGAGDMVMAASAFALASAMDLPMAMAFANFAAGMEVERIGAQPVPRRDMLRRLMGKANLSSEKVVELPELLDVLEHRRRRGEKIVFTNGCFDILHLGHISYLRFAKSQGDLLIVGLNSDRSVRALKGAPRPLLAQQARAAVLAALEAVDYVVIFDEETPQALINQVLPDILVKGEDWREKGVVGADTVEARGGRVVLAPIVSDASTTGIIERILGAYSGGKGRE